MKAIKITREMSKKELALLIAIYLKRMARLCKLAHVVPDDRFIKCLELMARCGDKIDKIDRLIEQTNMSGYDPATAHHVGKAQPIKRFVLN